MWHFREFRRGEIIHDSHEEEFFTMQTSLEAVVRESIQNSLDAVNDIEQPVMVRFLYSRAQKSAGTLFSGLKDHLVESGIPATGLGDFGFEFFAIEDFNTTGLTGETSYTECLNDGDGNFCNFWWVDGSSRKGMMKGGRWGLGKYSFFVFSKMRHFYGVTVTENDGKQSFMGRALIKRHKIGDKTYSPDGVLSNDDFGPIQEVSTISDVNNFFGLERGQNPGLSLIVPYPSMDNPDNVFNDILTFTIENYLYSIIAGKLTVKIEYRLNMENTIIQLSKDNISQFLRSKATEDRYFIRFERICELYTRILSKEPDFILSMLDSNDTDEIKGAFGDLLEKARHMYSTSNQLVRIRVPFSIKKQETHRNTETFVDIILTRDAQFKNEPVQCLRNGINVIFGIRDFKMKEGLALLTAEDDTATEFLGDAENPSHTEWSSRTERMRAEKYYSPEKILRLVKSLPKNLVNIMSAQTAGEDVGILSDIFYVRESLSNRSGKRPITPVVEVVRRPSKFNIVRSESGFKISLSDEGKQKLPVRIGIRTAYDTSDGNPFSKYSEFDYKMDSGNVKMSLNGGTLIELKPNSVTLDAEKDDFEFSVNGFDPRRDLIVDVKSKEVESS